MLDGYRFRLYPTREQERTLLRWIGCQRLIYNAKVSEDRYYRAFQHRFVGLAGEAVPVDQEYSRFKTEQTAFLNEVPSQVLRNGAVLFKQAYQRFFARLAGRPTFKRRSGPQAVWLTSEMFSFEPEADPETGEVHRYRLWIGTQKVPVGEVAYIAHRPHGVPASIHVSVKAGRWFVSFSAGNPDWTLADTTGNELAERGPEIVRAMPTEELAAKTCGADRGVAKPLATSDGKVFDLEPAQRERIQAGRRRQCRWQRRAARRQKGSRNQKKAYRRVARYDRYEADVRWDYAHQTSHTLVSDDAFVLYAFEDLPVSNMVRRPKAKRDEHGRWAHNGARAKAGLNRAILCSGWGQVLLYTRYKALRAGKLVVVVAFAYSSQECAACGHTHPDNRPSQAEFVCQRCGHTDNADHNAAAVIVRRGVRKVLSGEPVAQEKRSTRFFRNVGPERSERSPEKAATPGETQIRHGAGHTRSAHGSANQEPPVARPQTPTTARSA